MQPTLLLADDNVTIQRVIELTFADEQIRVIAVADGELAIARIDAEPPDVVLADVGMPKVDGYGVAAHIKRSPALAHIPVLLLTGAFDPIDDAKAKACGCDGVLVKPFEPQVVIARVKELIAKKHRAARTPPPVAAPPVREAMRESISRTPVPTEMPAEIGRARPTPLPGRQTPTPPAPRVPDAVRQTPMAGSKRDTPVPDAMRATPFAGSSAATPVPGAPRDRDPDLAAVQRKGDDVFEMELDELDLAFSRLDPAAAPGVLDVQVVSEFARDLHEMRSTPIPLPSGEAGPSWDDQDRAGRDAPPREEFLDLEVDFDPNPPAADAPHSAGTHHTPQEHPHAPEPARRRPIDASRLTPPQIDRVDRARWDHEVIDSPAAPAAEPAPDFAADFGDWDLPSRQTPIETLDASFMPPRSDDERPAPIDVPSFAAAPTPEPTHTAEPLFLSVVRPTPPAVVTTPLAPPQHGAISSPFERATRAEEAELAEAPPKAAPAAALAPAVSLGPVAPNPPATAAADAARTSGTLTNKVSIANAFSALLAAEQRQPALRPAPATPTLSDAVLDEVVRRVVARMSADAVQQVVVTTAERLVREEIERIKGGS